MPFTSKREVTAVSAAVGAAAGGVLGVLGDAWGAPRASSGKTMSAVANAPSSALMAWLPATRAPPR
jgi:hypothetical protein